MQHCHIPPLLPRVSLADVARAWLEAEHNAVGIAGRFYGCASTETIFVFLVWMPYGKARA